MDLSTKTEQELTNLIDNHSRRKLLTAPLYLEALVARDQRRNNGLEIGKSLPIILAAAREGRCVSYKQLAEASGAKWDKVRYAMGKHLSDLVRWGNGQGWPMLSAVVINSNPDSGEMKPDGLQGFITSAQDLGRTDIDDDHKEYLKTEQAKVFDFAREHPTL